MIRIGLFFEDEGHRSLLAGLCQRLAREERIEVALVERNASGGVGPAITELKRYAGDLRRSLESYLDVLIVAVDGNCTGSGVRERLVRKAIGESPVGEVVLAIPDPHVERWYLADPRAVPRALEADGAVAPPDQKCDKNRYKALLADAFATLDEYPAAGGIEYGGDVAEAIDFDVVRRTDDQLTAFVEDLKRALRLADAAARRAAPCS